MTSSAINVASQSLGLIRCNTISSFDEGTNEADIATLYYEDFVADILTRYPWSFAMKKRLLNQDSTPPVSGWQYSHIVPTEALRIWALYPNENAGAAPLKQFEIGAPSSGRRIYSNSPVLYADYTIRQNENQWTGYFTQFAIYAFAAHIAVPMTDDVDLHARMHQLAWGSGADQEKGGKFGVACSMDSQQKPPVVLDCFDLINARFS